MNVVDMEGRRATLGSARVPHRDQSAPRRRVDRPGGWPVMSSRAFIGPLGAYATEACQHSEADPVAVLLTSMALFGASVNAGPHVLVGNDRHAAVMFPTIVGATSSGGKGTSAAVARAPFAIADPGLMANRVMGGFGSAEALVDEVRDPDGPDDTDAPNDTRLVVFESEYARLLRVAGREGSVLSMTVRDAWDGKPLQARSRQRKAVASRAHVTLVSHVTLEELRARLSETETFGGWSNRFLFALAQRTQLLPDGGNVPDQVIAKAATEIRGALDFARRVGRVNLTEDAADLWTLAYYRIADDDPGGLVGALTAREAPQTLRLALIYALADGQREIAPVHLEAAWAVRNYCRQSVEVIWDDALGDEVADRLLAALRKGGDGGIDRTAQRDLFARHISAARLDVARKYLVSRGLIRTEQIETGGRPRTVDYAQQASEAQEVPTGRFTTLSALRTHSAHPQEDQ